MSPQPQLAGDTVGMDVWLPAIFGLLGTAVGAIAAMWGVKRTTEAAREQAEQQQEYADEQWRRDQRQTAYVAFLEAVDALGTHLETLAVQVAADRPIEASEWKRLDGEDLAVISAVDRIQITGSDLVEEAAQSLSMTLTNMCSVLLPSSGSTSADRINDFRMHGEGQAAAYERFKREAKETLGFLDPYRSEPPAPEAAPDNSPAAPS
jgi:hypothetical protein